MSGLGADHQGRVNAVLNTSKNPNPRHKKTDLKSVCVSLRVDNKEMVPVRARWDRPSADALAWRLRKSQTQKNRLKVGLCISLVDNKEMVPVGGLEPPRLFSNGF